VQIVSPTDANKRGSHVALRFGEAYRLMRALIDARVIGDFRAPNLMRFGLSPFYNSRTDVVRAAATLADLVKSRAWEQVSRQKAQVT
jgi:kynureninase